MKGLIHEENRHLVIASGIFVLSFFVYWLTQPKFPNPFNYFIYLADAFIHGRLYVIDTPFFFEELISYQGKNYVIYPPMPAVLLTPFVAIWGLEYSQVTASFLVAGFTVSAVYLLMRKLTQNRWIQLWITAMFGFGTIHWYVATVGSVWYFAQIVALFFLVLAIFETFDKARPLVIGLLLGAAYWSRIPMVLTLPFFIVMLYPRWFDSGGEGSIISRVRLKPLLYLGLGVGVFVVLNFCYNYFRFGSPFDVAYSLHQISESKEKVSPWFNKGLFDLSYIKYHLYVFLVQPPVLIDKPPYIVPTKVGLSILFTTPAFIFAFFAGIKNRLAIACWLAIIPVAILIFFKSGTGWTQFGYRYAMDFYPFLLLLTVRGIGDSIKWYHKVLICIGIIVNIWGVLMINIFEKYILY